LILKLQLLRYPLLYVLLKYPLELRSELVALLRRLTLQLLLQPGPRERLPDPSHPLRDLLLLLLALLLHDPASRLDLPEHLLVDLVLHLLDQLRLHVYLLKLLSPLERYQVLLAHVEHRLESVDRLVL